MTFLIGLYIFGAIGMAWATFSLHNKLQPTGLRVLGSIICGLVWPFAVAARIFVILFGG
jgi:hypothetical protein